MTSYQNVWEDALAKGKATASSWPMQTLFIPIVFWMAVLMWGGFKSADVESAILTLAVGSAYSLLSMGILLIVRRGRRTLRRLSKIEAIVVAHHNTFVILFTWSLALRMVFEFAGVFPGLAYSIRMTAMILLASSILLGILSAKRSVFPHQGEIESVSKQARWLPYIIGIQGVAVSFGVFMGAWFMHSEERWGFVAVLGLSTLLSMILATIGVIALFRSFILAISVREF